MEARKQFNRLELWKRQIGAVSLRERLRLTFRENLPDGSSSTITKEVPLTGKYGMCWNISSNSTIQIQTVAGVDHHKCLLLLTSREFYFRFRPSGIKCVATSSKCTKRKPNFPSMPSPQLVFMTFPPLSVICGCRFWCCRHGWCAWWLSSAATTQGALGDAESGDCAR